MKCKDCNPDYIAIPSDAVYWSGDDIPKFGIEKGMPMDQVIGILLKIVESYQSADGASAVASSDIVMDSVPAYLYADFAECGQRLGIKKGYFSVKQVSGDYSVSYNFADALSGIPADINVSNITVIVTVNDNGVQKRLSVTNRASNAYSITLSQFPVLISMKVTLTSDKCSDMYLSKDLTLPSIFADNKSFLFEIKGKNDKIMQKVTLDQGMNMMLAKIQNLNNYVEDIQAAGNTKTLNELKMQVEDLASKSNIEKRFVVGAGLGSVSYTESQFVEFMVREIESLKEILNSKK